MHLSQRTALSQLRSSNLAVAAGEERATRRRRHVP